MADQQTVRMKGGFISIVLIFSMFLAEAQQDHFVFIQDTEGKPFYVRMVDKSYSSSPDGHIILPMLKDSIYNMFIGFPGSGGTERLYSIGVNGANRGFELTDNTLTDIISESIVIPMSSQDKSLIGTRKSDTYSLLMAGVVNDTAVLYGNVVNSEEPLTLKKETKPVVVPPKKDTAKNAAVVLTPWPEPVKDTTTKTAAVVVAPGGIVYDKRDIIRYATENIVEGKLMIFLDRSAPVTDTIKLIIPRL
ncbi:MAG: hypothetical protein J7497_10725 [Chitinophagaceae bacterium]|nr:hypothetical protein [Chitinophagaceae bacterium]